MTGERTATQIGIFARTFSRGAFTQILDSIAQHGLRCIQFNFSCIGLPALPDRVPSELLQRIRNDCDARGIRIAGVSGTFNMIHPDENKRRDDSVRFTEVARATRELGCDLVSLCTGTRDPVDMWRAHPANESAEAWHELLESLEAAVRIAEKHGVLLGIEPEVGNVVSSARRARRLLDEMRSNRLKIIIDPANLFRGADVVSASLRTKDSAGGQDVRTPIKWMCDTIDEAFQLLGHDIVMAHAKELAPDGSMGQLAPGQGILDWDFYSDSLRRIGFDGPLIMHGLKEEQVSGGIEFLRQKLLNEHGASRLRAELHPRHAGETVRAPKN